MDRTLCIYEEISNKIKILLDVCDLQKIDNSITSELLDIDKHFRLNSSQYIVDWISAKNSSDIATVSLDFKNYLLSENIIQKLDTLSKNVFKEPDKSIMALMHNYARNSFGIKPTIEDKNTCSDCNVEYVVRPNLSDQYCPNCGIIIPLKGTVFETSDNVRGGPYKPSEHCETHVNCIFALELTEIPKEVIEGIKRLMRNENVLPNRQLTCKKIRQYLKELHQAQYNRNVPKIRLMLTGLRPPRPSSDKFNEICWYFDLADRIWLEIKPDNIRSRQYYPHRIRKIIEIVYKDDIRTRNTIIEGIHLQEESTYKIHDQYWEEICERSEGKIPFIKTEKYLYRY